MDMMYLHLYTIYFQQDYNNKHVQNQYQKILIYTSVYKAICTTKSFMTVLIVL